MIVTLPLLVYTLVFGNHVNDASRWIAIPGTGLSFQTSDLAKLIVGLSDMSPLLSEVA